MAVNALFITTILIMVIGLVLLQECQFLIPYKSVILHQYTGTILGFIAALFLNIFGGVYLLCRKVFLKDTGRKLAHLEKQLRTSGSISEELAARLRES
jgi:hypothetical protein